MRKLNENLYCETLYQLTMPNEVLSQKKERYCGGGADIREAIPRLRDALVRRRTLTLDFTSLRYKN